MTHPIPTYSVTTERLYSRLPDIYRDADEREGYPLKTYISAVVDQLGDVDRLVYRMLFLSQIDRTFRKRYAQRYTTYEHPDRPEDAPELGATSDLVDPRSADAAWLPWLAQLVGVKVTPQTSQYEARDAIAYASAGYRAGSKDALEKAVRTVLSGSRYALALPHTKVENGNLIASNRWDVTLLTRSAESPDSATILRTVNKPTVKPAGVRLFHKVYTASWDALEAALPFWTDWDTQTWDQIAQIGMAYRDLPGNIHPNPSFEETITGWSVSGPASQTRESGGVDGMGMLKVEVHSDGAVTETGPTFTLTANEAWVFGFSYSAPNPWTMKLMRGGTVAASYEMPATEAGAFKRYNSGIIPSTGGAYNFTFTASNAVTNNGLRLDGIIVRKS